MIKNPTLVIEFGGEGKGGKSSKKLRTFGRKIVRGGGKKEWKKKIANRSSFSLSFSSESVQQPVPEGFLRRQERVVKLLRRLDIHTHAHIRRRVWPPVVVTTPRFRPFDSAGASLIGNLGPEANGRRAPIRFLFLSSHVKYVAY